MTRSKFSIATPGPTSSAAAVTPGSLAAWRVAIRPPSLVVALSPVLVGASMAYLHGSPIALTTLAGAILAAVLMQVITNLQNDVGFTVRGSDAVGTRTGQPRATAQGWLSVREVRRAILLLSMIAVSLGLMLALEHGWPILLAGGLSLAMALAYMGGPLPIAYTPLSEVVVFVFFGLVAVLGTEALFSHTLPVSSLLVATAIGALAGAPMAANNHRDADHDRLIGRRTFVVLFGERASRGLFGLLLIVPFVCLGAQAALHAQAAFWLPWVLTPVAWKLWRDFRRTVPGAGFTAIVMRAFKLELQFAALLAMAAILSAG